MLPVLNAHKEGVTSFSMVHDSYGTHAADVDVMLDCTKRGFIELYSNEDPINELKKQLEGYIPDKNKHKIPKLPDLGDLDLYNLMNADYFFC